jgi:hypothetical protein
MPSRKLVRTRRSGWCDQEFAHPGEIRPGDLVLVTTYMPTDEHVRDFGVRPFTRTRMCGWCVERDIANGMLRVPEPHVSGSEG